MTTHEETMKTYLDWSAYSEAGMGDAYADIPKTGGDFAKAVAVCINSRRCEDKGKGVMCPSFRVTDNQLFSTGGRVRLLKQALNGELGELPFTNPQLAETMDLCVSCKGCKRECENEVDMAQIKLEYLAQRNALIPPSVRTRLFAYLPRWLHRKPWLQSLIAMRNRIPLFAWMGQKLLGIRADRPLPETSMNQFISEPPEEEQNARDEVVLFIDTFTHHYDPKIGHSAKKVLEAAGYRVHVAQPTPAIDEPERPLCCGRTFLAHGLVNEARREATRSLKILYPHAQAGRSIIGLEPACLLALRDDYRALGLGEAAEAVASRAVLFEEFIAREKTAKRWSLEFTPPEGTEAPLLVHGHCHQKAVGAMKSVRKVLKLVPGLEFTFIDASCCGGAGSFYLEAEHARHADTMAEQALLPTLRDNPDVQVIANGFACRQQICDGSQHRPEHLAVMLAQRLP